MKIKESGEWITLNVIIEKYKQKFVNVKVGGKVLKDEEGNNIKKEIDIFVKEVLVPTKFLKEGITMQGQTPNHQYRVQKTKSTIYDKYTNKMYVVKHTLDELGESLNKRSIVGFQLGKK